MSKSVVIGDIHGCYDTFWKLLSKLPDDIDQIYSVGDLVDRGPKSKEVVQLCIDMGIKAVRGNHEDMFMDFHMGIEEYDTNVFMINGGIKTIESYGGIVTKQWNPYSNVDYDFIYETKHSIPEEHIEYFNNMPYFIETDDFILSHAGIHPMRATGEFAVGKWDDGSVKSNTDLMWNREGWAKMNKIQVFGHTPNMGVQFVKGHGTKELAGINIDTSCGKLPCSSLTALIMPTKETIQVICTEI